MCVMMKMRRRLQVSILDIYLMLSVEEILLMPKPFQIEFNEIKPGSNFQCR